MGSCPAASKAHRLPPSSLTPLCSQLIMSHHRNTENKSSSSHNAPPTLNQRMNQGEVIGSRRNIPQSGGHLRLERKPSVSSSFLTEYVRAHMADAGSQPPVSNVGSNTFVTVPVRMQYPGGLPTGQAGAQVAVADTANVPQGDRISSPQQREECNNTQNLGDLALFNSRIKRLEAKVTLMSQALVDSRKRQESDGIVRFKDPLGRRFTFPFTLCRTWQGMKSLIEQAFCHMDAIWPQIEEGRYDLIAPHGEIVLPSVWDQTIKPNWAVSMYMWPIEKQPSSSESICETCGRTQSTQEELDQVVGQVSGGEFYAQEDIDQVLRHRLSPPHLIPHSTSAETHGHNNH